MGKRTPAPPPAPDPLATSAAQTQGNVQTAIANSYLGNADRVDPTGSTTYEQIGTETIMDAQGRPIQVPRFRSTTTLSPEQQRLYNQQTQLGSGLNNLAIGQVGRLDGLLGQPLNFDGAPERTSSISNDFGADRQRVEGALFERLNPQLQQQDSALRTRLLNQGITQGSEAWNRDIDESNRAANDARISTILNAGQEQSRLLSDALQRASFGNSARDATLQERLTLRNQPINEISALMSGGQVSMPQFQGYQAGNVAGTDIAGNINQRYQQDMAAYQQRIAQQNARANALGSLGGSIFSAGLGTGGFARGLF